MGHHPGQQAGAGSASWGNFKDIFSGIFSGAQQPQRPRGPQPGTDLEYQATVDFWTAIRGGQARLQMQPPGDLPHLPWPGPTGGPTQCPECNGTGQVTQMGGRMKFNIPCPRCNGTGRIIEHCVTCHGEGVVSRSESVEFRIKAGTRDGQRIRLQGKGNAGLERRPGRRSLRHRPHRHASGIHAGGRRHPADGSGDHAEASLGAKVDVPTIDGRAQLKIPPGTQSGQKLRMRERGVENAQHPGQRGDQIVTVEVVVPTLTRRAQQGDHARAGQAE